MFHGTKLFYFSNGHQAMSSGHLCKVCGQPLPTQQRAGIYLPPIKAAIFDYIDSHPGSNLTDIVNGCYHRHETVKTNVVKQHIYQINCMLAATDTSISGQGRREYFVIRNGKVDLGAGREVAANLISGGKI